MAHQRDKDFVQIRIHESDADGGTRRADAWRGLAERLAGPEPGEFPPGSDQPPGDGSEDGLARRDLLKLLGASMALAGVGGCLEPPGDPIRSYVERPPGLTEGIPVYYATSMVLDGFATGLLVQAREGRPIKIEGNPEHPASLGATGVLEQAALLELYDPARARAVWRAGVPASWDALDRMAMGLRGGDGVWFLMHPQSSPLAVELIRRVQARLPGARFAYDSPVARRAVYAAANQVFGRPLEQQLDLTRAGVVLSLDADVTAAMPNAVRWARDLSMRRQPESPDGMSRLYVIEPMLTPTGSLADHRLRVRAGEVPHLASQIFGALLAMDVRPPGMPAGLQDLGAAPAGPNAAWVTAVARDLARAAGASVVIAGPGQPAETHALAHLMNAALGNLGATVTMTAPALHEPAGPSLGDLAGALAAGTVRTLVILEANPVYSAPPELDLARLIAAVPETVHASLRRDETSRACQWHLPITHFLESWGDARAYDGTVSFMQPLVRPLLDGRSTTELLAAFAGLPGARGHDLLRDHWRERLPRYPSFEHNFQHALQLGFLADTREAAVQPTIDWQRAAELARRAATAPAHRGLELHFEVSPTVHDGRFASNPWLLELPHPMAKLTWDNAAFMSPATASRLGVDTGTIVLLRLQDAGSPPVRAPVQIVPGHADDSVTLSLGFGHPDLEGVGRGVGVNAYVLRPAEAPGFVDGLVVEPTDETYPLAITQEHWRLQGRDLVFHASLAQYRRNPDLTASHRGPLPSLLPAKEHVGPQWAMTVDTSLCTGCGACVVACQAENNIPVVGKDGVRRSREMHWLRIDRYFVGTAEEPEVINQPMMCQHCDRAPCEYVCPVNATVHSPDGLNEMVYNRCIGTRFCSNNCPYKVRRFNWFEYPRDGIRTLQHNPDVTVRERGVMEKCTYCVQRIRRAGIRARIEDRELGPGEVATACQQACPTRAIQFGSLTHPDTPMVQWRREPRAFAVLHLQGPQPRTWYLAKIRNPNPEIS